MNIELLSFLILSFFIAITPGPSVIYVVSYSLRYGPKAGVISTLGINIGSVIAILIAAFGLSSLLVIYPNAMTIIQVVGGIFVIYLATGMWPRGSAVELSGQELTEKSYRNLFKNGVITSALNPKDILFYTAFIPTFIPPEIVGESYQAYFLLLAFSYMAIGFVTKSAFAIFSGYTRKELLSKNTGILNYSSSIMLFALGLFLVGKSLSQ
ncbi:MAG: threonine/homoserine/homoserine lactone efflux protein [Parasphingorhabdus sp.]|jgi:threonine/homoserine/homoserine lactone efflux protein